MAKTACVAAVAAPDDLDAIAVGYIDAADGDPRVAPRHRWWETEERFGVGQGKAPRTEVPRGLSVMSAGRAYGQECLCPSLPR